MLTYKTVIINDFLTNYLIYSDGTLYNQKTQRWLKGTINGSGYRVYAIRYDGKKIDQLAHRLVAKAFLSNPNDLPVVNHKDGNKLNNNVENLERCTYSENSQHAIKTGLKISDNHISERVKYSKDLELDGEVWKQYKDSNYFVSNKGRIRNIKTGNLLKGKIRGDQGIEWHLHINGKNIYPLAHRIVYELFIGKLESDKVINHIDGNRSNNSIDNLEQITQQENVYHSYYITKNNHTKTVGKYDLKGNLIEVYSSCAEAARQNKGCFSNGIVNVCNKKQKTHHGYVWKYINKE